MKHAAPLASAAHSICFQPDCRGIGPEAVLRLAPELPVVAPKLRDIHFHASSSRARRIRSGHVRRIIRTPSVHRVLAPAQRLHLLLGCAYGTRWRYTKPKAMPACFTSAWRTAAWLSVRPLRRRPGRRTASTRCCCTRTAFKKPPRIRAPHPHPPIARMVANPIAPAPDRPRRHLAQKPQDALPKPAAATVATPGSAQCSAFALPCPQSPWG